MSCLSGYLLVNLLLPTAVPKRAENAGASSHCVDSVGMLRSARVSLLAAAFEICPQIEDGWNCEQYPDEK